LWVAIGCAGTRFFIRRHYIMRAAMALASQALDHRAVERSPSSIAAPQGVKSHFLAIHQPNLAENMI
jgi:hypothetical protein